MTSTCENCDRIVSPPPLRVGIMVDGQPGRVRYLCSACRVHVVDCFDKPAPWIGAPPVKAGAR